MSDHPSWHCRWKWRFSFRTFWDVIFACFFSGCISNLLGTTRCENAFAVMSDHPSWHCRWIESFSFRMFWDVVFDGFDWWSSLILVLTHFVCKCVVLYVWPCTVLMSLQSLDFESLVLRCRFWWFWLIIIVDFDLDSFCLQMRCFYFNMCFFYASSRPVVDWKHEHKHFWA